MIRKEMQVMLGISPWRTEEPGGDMGGMPGGELPPPSAPQQQLPENDWRVGAHYGPEGEVIERPAGEVGRFGVIGVDPAAGPTMQGITPQPRDTEGMARMGEVLNKVPPRERQQIEEDWEFFTRAVEEADDPDEREHLKRQLQAFMERVFGAANA